MDRSEGPSGGTVDQILGVIRIRIWIWEPFEGFGLCFFFSFKDGGHDTTWGLLVAGCSSSMLADWSGPRVSSVLLDPPVCPLVLVLDRCNLIHNGDRDCVRGHRRTSVQIRDNLTEMVRRRTSSIIFRLCLCEIGQILLDT